MIICSQGASRRLGPLRRLWSPMFSFPSPPFPPAVSFRSALLGKAGEGVVVLAAPRAAQGPAPLRASADPFPPPPLSRQRRPLGLQLPAAPAAISPPPADYASRQAPGRHVSGRGGPARGGQRWAPHSGPRR